MDCFFHVFFFGTVFSASPQKTQDLSALIPDTQFHRLLRIMNGDPHCKGCSFSLFALDRNRSVMADDRDLCDRQPKSGAADLTGAGFVYTIKSLKDACLLLFGNSDAVIRDDQFKIFFIRIDGNSDLSMLPVVFDSIFHQICQHQIYAGGIDLRQYLPAIHKGQCNIPGFRDRTHAL